MKQPLLIYNLFPLLAGPVARWCDHLERIAGMGFTWVYLNPFQYPGWSGSLYAVKDYFRFHPLLAGNLGLDPFMLFKEFTAQAREMGLQVMMDLVINHTASDAGLVQEHPEWYAKNPDGTIKHPSCIDPADARKVTVWGDLAELAYQPIPDPEGLRGYFGRVLKYYLELGVTGFRCDAAYKVPGEFWRKIMAAARDIEPGAVFVAETLGCRLEELAQLGGAGFDYFYNSSKWWDYQAPWGLEQYEANRSLAPSISFPETHDTPRLIREAGGNVAVVRQRYLFAAFFSAGLLMPMGFEYGLSKKLDVKRTCPGDWEERTYDLTEFITQVNRMKLGCPVLLAEGPISRLNPVGEPVVLLGKTDAAGSQKVLALINADTEVRQTVRLAWPQVLGEAGRVQEITPGAGPLPPGAAVSLELQPAGMRLFAAGGGER